jgi:hypothetical protein
LKAIGEFDGEIGALGELAGGIGILIAGPAHIFERARARLSSVIRSPWSLKD